MNHQDEELQKNIESGLEPLGDNPDVHTYRELFTRLKQEPDFHLPPDFSDSIIARVVAKKRRAGSRDFFLFGAGMFLLLIAFVVAVVITGFKPDFGFLNNMSSYLGLFIFGTVFILVLHFVDKKIIPHRTLFDETKKVEQ